MRQLWVRTEQCHPSRGAHLRLGAPRAPPCFLPCWPASLVCVRPAPPPPRILGLTCGVSAQPHAVPEGDRTVSAFSPPRSGQIYILNGAYILFPHVSTYFIFSFFEDDDDEVGDDEDEDDGFFVPHGYLSEDEGVTEVSGYSRQPSARGALSRAAAWWLPTWGRCLGPCLPTAGPPRVSVLAARKAVPSVRLSVGTLDPELTLGRGGREKITSGRERKLGSERGRGPWVRSPHFFF